MAICGTSRIVCAGTLRWRNSRAANSWKYGLRSSARFQPLIKLSFVRMMRGARPCRNNLAAQSVRSIKVEEPLSTTIASAGLKSDLTISSCATVQAMTGHPASVKNETINQTRHRRVLFRFFDVRKRMWAPSYRPPARAAPRRGLPLVGLLPPIQVCALPLRLGERPGGSLCVLAFGWNAFAR